MLSPEDKELVRSVNAHLQQESLADRRDELVEDYAQYLMKKGCEYYPWTRAHFEEALANAPEGIQMVAYAMVVTAIEDMGCDNDFANMAALRAIEKQVTEYWKALAVQCAERHVDFNP